MRIMVVGGGTGGHVFPGQAVVAAFRKRLPSADIVWVGTSHGLEGRLGANLGCRFRALPVSPMKGRGLVRKTGAICNAVLSCARALPVLSEERPDVVVGVGGYASGPVTLMAALKSCPTLIMEQNRIAGFTNRLLGKIARRVCVTYPDSARFFAARKVVCTGNPVRLKVMEEFEGGSPRTAGDFSVLVFGGSQGARAIDGTMYAAIPSLRANASRLRVVHQIGKGTDANALRVAYESAGIRAETTPFIEQMGKYYREADLVICRAGSSSLTELALTGRPAIVIPYPFAADDHQLWNARYYNDAGAIVLREEKDLSGEWLASEILRLMNDVHAREAMANALKNLARPNAAEQIVNECVRLMNV